MSLQNETPSSNLVLITVMSVDRGWIDSPGRGNPQHRYRRRFSKAPCKLVSLQRWFCLRQIRQHSLCEYSFTTYRLWEQHFILGRHQGQQQGEHFHSGHQICICLVNSASSCFIFYYLSPEPSFQGALSVMHFHDFPIWPFRFDAGKTACQDVCSNTVSFTDLCCYPLKAKS